MTIHSRAETFITEDVVRCSVYVPFDRETAFAKFGRDFRHWWPHDYTWSGDSLEALFFEGRKGGMVWERGPDGFRCDFARVQRYMPADWMLLRWHVAPDRAPEPNPEKASEVEIRFVSDDRGGTRIELEHRHFARHGRGWEAYCAAMGGRSGWPRILAAFAEHCGVVPLKQLAPPLRALAAAE